MPDTNKLSIALTLAFITAVGFLLRIINLGEPLWVDEVCSWSFARRMPFGHMWRVALSDATPPLYYILLHFVIRSVGEHPATMRLLSVFFGTLMIPVVYWTMRQGTFSRINSLYASLLCAVSSMLIFYSQELRAYILLAFLGVLSTGVLFRCLRDCVPRNLFFYGASLVLLSWAHRYGFLLICAQCCALIVLKKWRLGSVLCAAGVLALMVPFMQMIQGTFIVTEALDRRTNLGSVLALITMLNAGTIALGNLTGLQPGPDVAYPQPAANVFLAIAGLVTFVMIFCCGWIRRKEYTAAQRQNIVILVLCILIPAVLALLAGTALMPTPAWLLRGLLFIWPLYYLLAGIAAGTCRTPILCIAAIAVINAGSLFPYYVWHERCPSATALMQLNSITTADDLIVADQWWYYEIINYYYHGSAQRAAYWKRTGWIDVQRLATSDKPFHASSIETIPPPKADGSVFFYIDISNPAVIKEFPQNKIFIYDQKLNWRRIK